MRLVQTSWSSFWMVQHASSSTISGLCFRSTSTQRPSTRTDGCSYHLVVVLPCHRPSHPLRSSTMCFLLPSDACLPTPTLHSPRSPSSPSSRPSRTFLHGFHSRPRTVPFLFPAFPSAWTECVEDDVPWFRSVSFVSIRFHTTDRTRATRGRPVPISSDHVLFVSPPKTDPIGSIGRSDEAKPRGRRRRFCTDDEDEDEMATRARVVRLPGVQACTRRVPAKVKAAVDAMEEPLWEGHAERMRMLLEREAREAMKRQVHRLDKVRARTPEQARPEKKTGEIPERFLRN